MSIQLQKDTPLSVLSETQSLAAYNRQRKVQFFEQKDPGKPKSHSPATQDWDTHGLVEEVENTPPGTTIIWQQLAQRHGVSGSNRGQVAKEYVAKNFAVDISQFQSPGLTANKRTRVSRKRLLSSEEISCPVTPSPKAIQNEWESLIQKGTLSLGVPCVPYKLKRTNINGSNVEINEVLVYGRKLPLLDIRKRLLSRHEKFMYLMTDATLQDSSQDRLLQLCQEADVCLPHETTHEDMVAIVKNMQRNRYLGIWHDHATILGRGYIMVTVKVIYDTAYFQPGSHIQSIVEEPEIHILGLSSSSCDDQVAFVPDRQECLQGLHLPVLTSNNIPVHDTIRFFCGDHPAQDFERGTQQGGWYKCGGCGIKSNMISDFSHAMGCKWRSFSDIQTIALGGYFGKQQGVLKPFSSLSVAQLRKELKARGQWDLSKKKPELQLDLSRYLSGVQRVPTLLINNPTQTLPSLNLQKYEVLGCEPLHDIKGHLFNLFEELPYLLPADTKKQFLELKDACFAKEKISGADMRCLAIQTLLLFNSSADIDQRFVLLMKTIVEISNVIYSPSQQRCSKLILRLYNLTWIHHELCVELFTKPCRVSLAKLFGIYFHSLCVHAPHQFEVVSLSSVNSEREERLFGQARRVSSSASSRHPDSVIKNILLRIQGRNLVKGSPQAFDQGRVSKLAEKLDNYSGSVIKKTFIEKRTVSWQYHLERISPFLIHGPGVWWHDTSESYTFLDGHSDQEYHNKGPQCLSFLNNSLKDVSERRKKSWSEIVKKKIPIPTDSVRIYNSNGDLVSKNTSYNSPHNSPLANKFPSDTITDITSPDISTLSNVSTVTSTPLISDPTNHSPHDSPLSNEYPVTTCTTISDITSPDNSLLSNLSTAISDPTNHSPDDSPLSNKFPVTTCTTISDIASPDNSPLSNVFTVTTTPAISDVTNNAQSSNEFPESNAASTNICETNFSVPQTSNTGAIQYKTKLARALNKLFGASEELNKLDTLRSALKEKSSHNNFECHQKILANFQLNTLRKKSTLEKQLTSDNRDFNQEIYQEYQFVVKLLRSWDIKL